jgi:protein SCO1/2
MKFGYLLASLLIPYLPAAAADALGPKSIYQLDQKWTSQAGKEISLSDLKGRPVVATLIFTSCPATCPIIVSNIKALDSQLTKKEKQQIRYVLFSMDPTRDTATALAAFAKKMKLDGRWTLLTSNKDQVREISAVLGFNYKPLDDGDFTHSTALYLLSAKGELAGRKDSDTSQSEFLKTVRTEIKTKSK